MNGHRPEKLKIVFALDCESGTNEVEIGQIKFTEFVQAKCITAISALRIIISVMRQLNIPMEFKDYGQGKSIPVESYLKRVEKRGRWVHIEVGGLSFRFAHVAVTSFKHSFIIIEEINAGSAVSWESWIKPFLAEESFVQAWVSDVEYDYWQNAKDPLQYKSQGRSYAHLPMKSNGFPPPVEQMEIDTSNNPGRWSFQSDYIEAIGATMWLSGLFWKHIGENRKDALLSTSGFEAQIVENGIMKVVSSEYCFCDETTEDVQRKLRSVLYGTSS